MSDVAYEDFNKVIDDTEIEENVIKEETNIKEERIMKKRKITISCMELGTVLMACKVMLSYSRVIPYSNTFDTLLIVISLICFITRILLQKYSDKTLIAYALITILALYSCSKANNNSLLITIITLFALRDYNIEKFLKTIYRVESFLCLLHVVYSLSYSILVSWDRYLLILDNRYRFSFGFLHANTFSALLFCNLMLYIWLNYSSNLKKVLLKTTIIEVAAYLFTNSRTALTAYVILVFFLVTSKSKLGQHIIREFCKIGIPIISISFMALIKGYIQGNPISYLVNTILTSRVKLGAYAYKDYGVTFAGQYIEYFRDISWDQVWQLSSFTFDNVYSFLAISLGIVWIIILTYTYYQCAKDFDIKSLMFMGVWIIYGLTETTILNGYFCFPIFLTVGVFKNTNQSMRKK